MTVMEVLHTMDMEVLHTMDMGVPVMMATEDLVMMDTVDQWMIIMVAKHMMDLEVLVMTDMGVPHTMGMVVHVTEVMGDPVMKDMAVEKTVQQYVVSAIIKNVRLSRNRLTEVYRLFDITSL